MTQGCWLGAAVRVLFSFASFLPEQNKKAGGQNGEGQKVFDQRIPLLYQAKGDGFLCGGEKKIAAVFLAVLPLPVLPRLDPNGVPSIGLWKPAVNGVGDGV